MLWPLDIICKKTSPKNHEFDFRKILYINITIIFIIMKLMHLIVYYYSSLLQIDIYISMLTNSALETKIRVKIIYLLF